MGDNAKSNPSVRRDQKENSSINTSRGRSGGDVGSPSQDRGGRERNVGHGNAEEHSRVAKK
jgi:hypothetical protein